MILIFLPKGVFPMRLALKRVLPLVVLSVFTLPILPARASVSLFFLHHSVGRYLIQDGDVRARIAARSREGGPVYRFWDHDYNYIGLRNPDGVLLGYYYGIATGNTDPDGLRDLFTTDNSARDSIMNKHDVIAFKSCFTAMHITSDSQLQEYKGYYLAMRDFFDQHPEKIFVIVSPPPLHRLATTLGEADRVRLFADWLCSSEYLDGHPNMVAFHLFDLLAHPDDGSSDRNMLRYEYESSHTGNSSHPNDLANQTIGPMYADFMIQSAQSLVAAETHSWSRVKAMYRGPEH
jgi:hypothetical protein